jgi:hypothetical protein
MSHESKIPEGSMYKAICSPDRQKTVGPRKFVWYKSVSNIAENNVNTLVPTQDVVHEFRVSTNNVSAEFGGYGGGVVQISTKSGTNQYHGTAYEYFRNTALANDWFSNNAGLGKVPLHQNSTAPT